MFVKIFGYFVTGFLLLLQLSPALAAPKKISEVHTRIVGGTEVDIAVVPYLMQMLKDDKFHCGGSLVAEQFVVTAAHCVKGVSKGQLTIVGGATKISDGGVKRSVKKIIIHKDYNEQTITYDVALLKLNAPMKGEKIATIKLHNGTLSPGKWLKVSGWGLTNENGQPSNHARTVSVAIVPKATCNSKYGHTLTSTMICAAAPQKDSCAGDSGGPAVNGGKLYAIVSWGYGCARDAYPGVYTSVQSVAKFITDSMN